MSEKKTFNVSFSVRRLVRNPHWQLQCCCICSIGMLAWVFVVCNIDNAPSFTYYIVGGYQLSESRIKISKTPGKGGLKPLPVVRHTMKFRRHHLIHLLLQTQVFYHWCDHMRAMPVSSVMVCQLWMLVSCISDERSSIISHNIVNIHLRCFKLLSALSLVLSITRDRDYEDCEACVVLHFLHNRQASIQAKVSFAIGIWQTD